MKKAPGKFTFLMAVLAGVCWGTYGTFANFMGEQGLDSSTIALFSPLFCMIFFFILVCLDNIRKLAVRRRFIPVLLIYGGFAALLSYSLASAYLYLPIGIVSTIVYCNLFLIMVFSYFLFKDPMTWKKWLAAALAVLGVAMVLNVFSLEWSLSIAGVVWTLLALVSWATTVICEKYLLNGGVDGNAVMTYNGFFAVLFLSIATPPWRSIANLADAITATHGAVLLPTLAFGILTTIGCYFFYINALKKLEPAYVQLGFVMDPLTASVLGFLVFGQALLPIQIVGIALILLVVIWIQWSEVQKLKRLSPPPPAA